jgi:hypothetical protein
MIKHVGSPSAPGISFAVDDVVPDLKPIWTEPLVRSINRRFRREVLLLPHPEKPVINLNVDYILSEGRAIDDEKTIGSRWHPLLEAVHTAFSRHYPLKLSPDAIWFAIAQGFSHHVAENAEILRHRLVRHQGRARLEVEVSDLSLGSFDQALTSFSSQIREASDPVLHETLLCDFTTTTPTIRTASEIVLMDTYSSYFQYVLRFICGIPRITLTGTLEDWQRILSRVEVLATYDLEWWVSRLRPIIDEFIRTIKGQPDLEFWKAIYIPKETYGGEIITGWIADLFPYLGDAPERWRNHIFDNQRKRWAVSREKGVGAGAFPSGLSSVPIHVEFQDGSSRPLELVAGYTGVVQSPTDLAISPLISWSVTVPRPEQPVLI